MGAVYHVVPYSGRATGVKWALKKEGYEQNSSLHEIKNEAISEGKEAARSRGGSVIVHRRNGTVQNSFNYNK